MPFQKILIYADASPQAYNAARTGLALAAALGAEAGLVLVLDEALAIGNIDAGQTHSEAEAQLQARGEQLLDQLAALAAPGQHLSRFLPWGRPVEQVLATVAAWPADLLVVGTKGPEGLLTQLMGGAVEERMQRARCPLLEVPLN